jgi:DNA-binding XRE family transcriptional regulator
MAEHPLRKFRRERKISQRTMAAALNVSTPTISRLERGQQTCTPEMAIAIENITKFKVLRQELRPDLWGVF